MNQVRHIRPSKSDSVGLIHNAPTGAGSQAVTSAPRLPVGHAGGLPPHPRSFAGASRLTSGTSLTFRMTFVLNNVVMWLTTRGISLAGSRVLSVRGRKTGEFRSNPVNLMIVDGGRFLVAPRGETQWVRNLRVAGEGRLRLGRRVETFRAVEVTDDDKPPILRAYLARWAWEVGRFFEGVDAHSPDEVLRAIAPGFPVFRLGA